MPVIDDGERRVEVAEIRKRDQDHCATAAEVIRQSKAFMEDAATEAGTDAHKDNRYGVVQRWLEMNDVVYRRSSRLTLHFKNAMNGPCLKCAAEQIRDLFKSTLPQIRIGHITAEVANNDGPLGIFQDNTDHYREMTTLKMESMRKGDWIDWKKDQVFELERRK
jgi:hypothetical protein